MTSPGARMANVSPPPPAMGRFGCGRPGRWSSASRYVASDHASSHVSGQPCSSCSSSSRMPMSSQIESALEKGGPSESARWRSRCCWRSRSPDRRRIERTSRAPSSKWAGGATLPLGGLARPIHEASPQQPQTAAFGGLLAPGRTVRLRPSSTTLQGRLRAARPRSTDRDELGTIAVNTHEQIGLVSCF